MRKLWIWLSLSLLGVGLPRAAGAYCLTHTCEFSGTEQCTWDPELSCWTGGTVAHWGSRCIHYAVQADGSRAEGISADELSRVLATAFRTWSGVACGGGLSPELTTVERGRTRCDQVEFNCEESEDNDNIVLFRDGRSDLAATTIALTTTVANIATGEILDVDVEINSQAFDFYVDRAAARPGDHDLQLVLNHELGHFLGLSHTLAPGALMRAEYEASDREPAADDIAGMCRALGQSASDPQCSVKPSPGSCVGTDASCPAASARQDDGSCALAAGSARNGRSGVLLVATGLLLLGRGGFTRRPRQRRRHTGPAPR